MESLFPELFFLSYFAMLVPRIALALIMLYDATKLWKTEGKAKWLAPGMLVLGGAIGAGFLTQGAVILASILVAVLAFKKEPASVFQNRALALLSIAVLLTLLLTGPGGLAIDLPY